jgi:hypothetical protein
MSHGFRAKLAIAGFGASSFITLVAFQNFTAAPAVSADEKASSSAGAPDSRRPWFMMKKGAGISGGQELNRLKPANAKKYPTEAINRSYAEQAAGKIETLNAKWYYTWSTKPLLNDRPELNFVPMIFSSSTEGAYSKENISKGLDALVQARGQRFPKILLYNEPDHEEQGNLTPAQAQVAFTAMKPDFSKWTDSLVSPVQAGPGDRKTGEISWLDQFFANIQEPINRLSEPSLIDAIAQHHYIDPVKSGFVPPGANPDDPNDAFYSDPEKVEKAAHKMAVDFLSRLLAIHRRYGRPIWITEFGVVDRGTYNEKGSGCLPAPLPAGAQRNRIKPALIVRFLEKVLPELQMNSYIARYALFTNTDAHKELNRMAAIFKAKLVTKEGVAFCDTSELTDEVGKFYANFQPKDLCQRGEYQSAPGQMTEWVRAECGMPRGPGWRFNQKENQYRRDLSFEEAKVFTQSEDCNRWRDLDRRNPSEVTEGMTEACVLKGIYKADASRGWKRTLDHETNTYIYSRVANVDQEKLSIFIPGLAWR